MVSHAALLTKLADHKPQANAFQMLRIGSSSPQHRLSRPKFGTAPTDRRECGASRAPAQAADFLRGVQMSAALAAQAVGEPAAEVEKTGIVVLTQVRSAPQRPSLVLVTPR